MLNSKLLYTELEGLIKIKAGRGIVLEAVFERALKPVAVIKSQLEQVIMNLVINASQAMPQGGNLTIGAKNVIFDGSGGDRKGKYICLFVSDTGMGMDEKTQAHIFEPLFTTKKQGEGTGLGLFVTNHIIRNHGGWINVKSEVGKGTTFEIYLPASQAR